MLVHSILSAEGQSYPTLRDHDMYRMLHFQLSKKFRPRSLQIVKKNKKKFNIEDFVELETLIRSHLVRHVFRGNLKRSITVNFGSALQDLVRSGCSSSLISVMGRCGFSTSLSKRISIRQTSKQSRMVHSLENDLRYAIRSPEPKTAGYIDGDSYTANQVLDIIISSALNGAHASGLPRRSFYFPASRSGLLQGYRELSAGLMHNAQLVDPAEPRSSRLSGVVSDFVSSALLLSERRGFYNKLASEMESELLGGSIDLVENKAGTAYDIFYQTPDVSVPLHRTSSTVSEIAPLSLYLKHTAHPGSLLVIEEPESHLHVANQAVMAKYIARMVRYGLNVLVTTHSSAIVDEIGVYLRSSGASPAVRKKLKFSRSDYLKFDEVAPYVFEGSARSGYAVRKVETDTEVGIPHDEYVHVLESLYDRSTRLDYAMAGA